jgi:hypothetical protein
MTETDDVAGEGDAPRQGAPLLAIFLLVAVLALLLGSGFTGEVLHQDESDRTDLLVRYSIAIVAIACPGIVTGLVLGLLSQRKSAAVPAGMALGLVFGLMSGLAIISGGNAWLLVIGIPVIFGVALVGRMRSGKKPEAA